MKKTILTVIITIIAFGAALAQESYEICAKSDSIITLFSEALKNVNYEKTELVSMGDNFFVDEEECDTFLLENSHNFKFLKTKEKDSLTVFEYYNGNIYDITNEEKLVYYFCNQKLLLTCNCYFTKFTSPYDEYALENGYNFTFEEKRMVFAPDGKPWGYIVRDGEGNSKETDVAKIKFSKIDLRHIIYDKNRFETIGQRLMDGDIDFLYY